LDGSFRAVCVSTSADPRLDGVIDATATTIAIGIAAVGADGIADYGLAQRLRTNREDES
jgi:hypothetical protein